MIEKWRVWELADDYEAYGENAGRCIITSADGEREILEFGVMDESEATAIVNSHNAALLSSATTAVGSSKESRA